MNILIIGSDSFIAQKFISYSDSWNIKGISRTTNHSSKETIINDLFTIGENHFVDTDIVINFAAIVHQPYVRDVRIYNEVNHRLAVLNALKAKRSGVKLFIQMSTIGVYGDSTDISVESACNPMNPYATSKLNADQELLIMQDDHFKVTIIRPPMVYGGGNAPGNMMRLIRLAHKGIPLPFKSIDNKRDFIHVNNLVQYLHIICERKLEGIMLVSDHQPVSTEFLLNIVSNYTSKKIMLIKVPYSLLRILHRLRPNEYNKLFGSLNLHTNFPYEDQIKRHSVEEGIKEMMKWYIDSHKKHWYRS
jgi:UDP-glucose 4-epimerase